MTRPSTILVATDFSRTSEFAIEYATAQATMAGATLLIVHVFTVPSIDKGEGLLHHGIDGENAQTAERRLRALRPTEAEVAFEHRFAKGEPADEILRLATEEQADLIIMGTQGRTGLLRMLMGSVAEQVLRGSTCPVLTVRVPEALSESPESE